MIRLVLRALACWRLTELVTADEVTRPVREWVAKRRPGSKIAYLIGCPACVSVWAGFAVAVLPEWMCTALASSAASILLTDAREQQAAEAARRRMETARGVRQAETG